MSIIELKDLTKKYGNKIVVNKLNFGIEKGELFSLLGVNGAGKTTTIKMLTCLTMPTDGDALLENNSIKENRDKVKEIVNVSPQETAVAPNLSVKENLEFIAGVYDIKNKQEKVKQLLKDFNLEEVSQQKTKTLSGGYKRRLSIAMALINDPKILFLDEPTLGLDVIARRELWKIIKSLKEKTTIVLTTHYMEEAELLSDRIGIMSHGVLVAIGTAKELIKKASTSNFEDAFVELATGGKNENN